MATYGQIQSVNTIQVADPHVVNILQGYMPPGLVADQIFPKAPQSADYGRIPIQNGPLQIEATIELAPTGFPTIELNYTATDFYQLKNKGLQAHLTPSDLFQLGGEARARSLTYNLLDTNVKLQREWGIASALTNASVITQNFTPSYLWDNYDSSDPIADFAKARSTVRGGILSYTGCGFAPNTAIMSWTVFNRLCSHPQLVKAYYQAAFNMDNMTLDEKQLAVVMKVKRVIVAEGRYDAAEKGQTKSLADIWGNNCIFAYIAENIRANEAQQSLGYTFVPTSSNGPAEFAYDWTTPGVLKDMGFYVVRGMKFDDHLTDVTCACLLPNIVTA